MKVTAKGQITIPQAMREKAGIRPGCEVEVEFVEEDGALVLRKVGGTGRGKWLVEHMTGRGNGRMTTDEIMKLTRGDDWGEDR